MVLQMHSDILKQKGLSFSILKIPCLIINVTISYGCYFAGHGLGQKHTKIIIEDNVYFGLRCNILSGKKGIRIGKYAIIGAGSLVNKSVAENAIVVGVPIKVIGVNKRDQKNEK